MSTERLNKLSLVLAFVALLVSLVSFLSNQYAGPSTSFPRYSGAYAPEWPTAGSNFAVVPTPDRSGRLIFSYDDDGDGSAEWVCQDLACELVGVIKLP